MALPTQVIFVDADYIKAYSQVGGSIDEKYFLPAILTAQDKYIQPILGTNLYDYLKTNIASLPTAYATLMDNYIRRTVMYWTLVELYPYLSNKVLNSSISQISGDNATPISKAEVDSLIAKERNNAQFYSERLIDYLQNNQTTLAEYNAGSGADMSPITTIYYENGLTISGAPMYNPYTWIKPKK
jgi:hypothetical protein|tara:strand:- start:802 stop:1356 length:555 start_codon:yes stop_codon:yes gene_type:complete